MRYDTEMKVSRYKNCRNEQDFKRTWANNNKLFWKKIFCIETEETIAGFPDVMLLDMDNRVYFLEFKIADKNGRFKFQSTQPAFYRQNKDLPISVIVLDKTKESYIHFKPQYLFDGNLLSPKATVLTEQVLSYIKYHNLFDENEKWF